MWAVEARSRPYGAGRAVETLVGLSRRCGYPGTRVALWSKCGWVSPAPYAQRPHLADQRDRHHSDFWQPTVARSRPCQSPVERSETSFDWGVAACGRSGCCPTCTCITNALATLHLADQRAREASARHANSCGGREVQQNSNKIPKSKENPEARSPRDFSDFWGG